MGVPAEARQDDMRPVLKREIPARAHGQPKAGGKLPHLFWRAALLWQVPGAQSTPAAAPALLPERRVFAVAALPVAMPEHSVLADGDGIRPSDGRFLWPN